MATLSTLTARILSLLGSEASLSTAEAESLVQTRYEHLYETWCWSKRLRDFGVSLVAQVTSGTTDTVTVTLDSAVVTSAGTPFTTAMTGRQIQIGDDPQYFFVLFTDSANLKIQDGEGTDYLWPRATAADQSWRIFKTIYTLPTTARDVVSLAGSFSLDELDGGRARLDTMDPERSTTNSHPTHWLYAGANSGLTARELEVWPVPTEARLLRGQFNREAPTLSAGTTIDMPTPVLVYAATADACHLLHAKQGSQETMWEQKALFFERKANEVAKDYKVGELEMTSPPTQLGRAPSNTRLASNDYEVSHQIEMPY